MAISKLVLNGEVQMDVTSDTVTAGSMLSGTTATKNDGTKATGTIASKSSTDMTVSGATVTAPAGYYANAASKAVATTTHPNPSASITSSTGVVTASHTQGTGYVTGGTTTGTLNLTTQAGKTVTPTESAQTAVASYRWTTGNVNVAAISSTYVGTGVTTRSSANLTASGSVVTAPAGYYSTAATKAVAAGSAFPPAVTITKAPTIGVNTSGVVTASYNGSSSITPTVTSGYVSQGTAGTISTTGTSTYQLTSKAAATYYPSTADQTIASQRWLVGAQTIKSVTTSNLTAENIAEGVIVKVGDSNNASRITQVTGTHSGAASYTATIGDSRFGATGSGNSTYCYVSLNGTKYYTYGGSFSFKAGDVLTIYCRGNYFIINGYEKSLSSYTYSYTLPDNDINITMDYTNSSDNCIYIKDVPPNDAVSFWISYDETTWEPIPHCNKTYNECKQTITTTDAHAYCIDSNANLLLTGVIISNGNAIRYRRYEGEQGDGVSEEFIYYSNGTISYTRNPISHLANINITSNGTYSSASTYYKEINVSVQGSGFTADQIAMQTISGSISGNASYIAEYAFYHCYNLTSVEFPSATSIGKLAFTQCTSITRANFPMVTLVGSSAFSYCSRLATASFPRVTTFMNSVFYSCLRLTALYLDSVSAVPTLGTNVFYSTPIGGYSNTVGKYGSVFVPASLYNSFLTATNWSSISARIVSV